MKCAQDFRLCSTRNFRLLPSGLTPCADAKVARPIQSSETYMTFPKHQKNRFLLPPPDLRNLEAFTNHEETTTMMPAKAEHKNQ
jgi:hypothetical protein